MRETLYKERSKKTGKFTGFIGIKPAKEKGRKHV